MSRLLIALLAAAATRLTLAAVEPVVPCDRPVGVFGGSTVLAEGVRTPQSNGLAVRLEAFFARSCGAPVKFETIAEHGDGVIEKSAEISAWISRHPRSIAFIHFPAVDIESGASPEQLLRTYRSILETCSRNGTLCIIGGQQPVNRFSDEAVYRQLELERRAAMAFGGNYLPLYRHFQSESRSRRLMLPVDSGDGRHLDDRGHELLFKVYRRRLLELTGPNG